MALDLNIATYQAEVNQRKAAALAEQNAAIAAAAAKHKEETAWANSWKTENNAYVAQMLRDKQIDKATHDAEVRRNNEMHALFIKDINAAQAELNKSAKDAYTAQVKEADLYLKDMQAEIAAEQKRVKDQFDLQKKLSAEAKKVALADLAFEKALYTAADYNKKVADINADYARIDDAINTAYNTIPRASPERREEYLRGGIGSLSAAQELLAKSKAALPPPTPAPGTPAAPLKLDTSTPTAVSGPAPAPVATPSQLTGTTATQGGISEEERARARAAVAGGIGAPPPLPAIPQAPTGPQQPPVTATPSPYGDIFSKEQQFPSLLQGAANPYLPTQQPLVPNLTPQQPQPPMPNMQFQPMQPTNILQGLQQPTGQTLPAQSALPFSPTTPVNPYIDAYQGMLQTARPPEEQTPVPQATTTQPTQTAGMF